jgi:hypothetical protein
LEAKLKASGEPHPSPKDRTGEVNKHHRQWCQGIVSSRPSGWNII